VTRIPYTQQEQAAAIIPGIPGARVWADDPAVATVHRGCWPARLDLGKRWPSRRLVATAAENRLSFRHDAHVVCGGQRLPNIAAAYALTLR
jgi:hypothetical protein